MVQKVSEAEGGLGDIFDGSEDFGNSITLIGDLDGDGVQDLVVGAPYDDAHVADGGAIYVLFMNADMTVKSSQRITEGEG